MNNIILHMKWQFNKCIDKIKLKNINQCSAIVYNKTCKKLTKHKYCDSHYTIYNEYCKLYHYWDNQSKYSDMNLSDLIDVEIHMRNKYVYLFDIKPDYNHEKWLYFLRLQKHNYDYNKYYFSINSIYNDIMYNKIDKYDLKYIQYLNLSNRIIDNNIDYFLELSNEIILPTKENIYNDYYDNNIYNHNYIDKRKSI
ncbi:unknown similar to AMEV022 [Choristoneura rosaceana entomopoxvirus 'L']|uniref:N1R/p28-like protein n=1 Tax=Choristoneura rosaceana entomopoxvirus 'L' TaxID=1293539 RepID=A0ABM9QK76_9POXV|nr:unknown similar to AMEV022 [Choristoneura rosaceana entomopoxvirus 'L']CCU55938.1 unknown similar to AMEV022 [Choristoneura rosaceana entomopoxvirus 'L']